MSSRAQVPDSKQVARNPALIAAVLRRGSRLQNGYRVWELARSLGDSNKVSKAGLRRGLGQLGFSKRTAYRQLRAFLAGPFVRGESDSHIYWASDAQLALVLDVDASDLARGGRVVVSAEALRGTLTQYRAGLLQAVEAWLSKPLRTPGYRGRADPRPVSRATIQALTGLSPHQQRRAEQRAGISAVRNHATTKTKHRPDADALRHQRYWFDHPWHTNPDRRYWTTHDGHRLHERLPNSYRTGLHLRSARAAARRLKQLEAKLGIPADQRERRTSQRRYASGGKPQQLYRRGVRYVRERRR